MKKSLLFVLPLFLLASCGEGETSMSSLEIADLLPNGLDVGETLDLASSGLEDVTWSIDDPLVASLEGDTLTALRTGVISVTATSKSDPESTSSKYITVSPLQGVSVTFTSETSTVRAGESFKFLASVSGNVTDKSVGYLVSNDAIASIDEDGTLHAKKEGNIVVTAYSILNPDSAANVKVEIIAGSEEGTTETREITTPEGNKETYHLIYEDDFLGGKLNETSWEPMLGNGSAYNNPGWGNDEQQFYKEENAKVVDGNLVITAKYGDPDKGLGLPTTSARLRSAKKVAYTYGYIEARISCPVGYGLWPAFWMLPENDGIDAYGGWPNSGEIDILEAKGRLPYGVDGTIHFSDKLGNHVYTNGHYDLPDGDDITNWHTYAVRWEEGSLAWYCDGNLYFYLDAEKNPWTTKEGTANGEFPAPFDKNFHILINLAVGGNYDGNRMPGKDELPAQMKVDYVKWYQK